MIKNRLWMAWNKPGGQNEGNKNNPWGQKGNTQGPPDLEEILRRLINKFKALLGNGLSFGTDTPRGGNGNKGQEFTIVGAVILGVLLFFYVVTGIYIIDPPERAVITRFGKYVRTEEPGPHWLPAFIESKEIVNVEQVGTSDHSGLMLTRDGNIVSVSVAVQYRIGDDDNDVRSYLFNVVNPIRSLNQSVESALRQVVGQSTMDEVLTLKRSEIATAIKEQLIATLKNYDTGIRVLDVVMQYAKAPDEVRAAFDEVIKASADEERLVNQARGYENEVLPRAKGNAERLRNEALGYKQETILIAEGNVQRFNLVLPQYLKAPKVMQTRMYLDTLEEILSKSSKILVDAGLGNNLIYLPLDRIMTEKTGAEASASSESTNNSSNTSNTSNINPKELPSIVPYQKEKNQ